MMAKSAQSINERDFDPLHPDKAPICDKCEKVTYTVYQAICCGAYLCVSCKTTLSLSPLSAQPTHLMCLKCNGNLGEMNYDYNETQKRKRTEVYCCNKRTGCQHKGEIRQMNEHLSDCLYEEVSCKHEKCNKKILRKDQQWHHKNCPDRIVQCKFCKDKLRAAHLEQFHLLNGCQDYPKDCPNKCGKKVTDRELSVHRETCSHEPIGCLFTKYGCTQTVQRDNMTQHVLDYKHMELLLKEIDKSYKNQQMMQQTIQSLQTEVEKLRKNYTWMVREDMGKLNQSQKDVQTKHQNLHAQVSAMEKDFQFHKMAFESFKGECKKERASITQELLDKINPIENDLQHHRENTKNFMVECKMIQDGTTQANTLPFKFIVNNTEELLTKGKAHHSPYFYTECRRHKLRLTIGKGATQGNFMSLRLHRISNYGVKKPESVKIQVVVALISQLPNTTEADNFVVTIDATIRQHQQEEIIYVNDEFISFRELDHTERRRTIFRHAHIQYKMNDSLLFQIKSAVEATLM